eukprot:CAMPEP_0202823244 /NCGR_PEP_ID=MMETSP1389-20130828/11610_1 /ASSEMBLY_ACC=CAM_ASM_000865 /TAXON_ID=302021 /ORGANISM="Rhodomonas sp., Strain CCMP768" /LENGTH=193 /DNA_ID=CAMNT_0049496237 /DNA_START=8 /DNA_END=589 /DNA_ORIENTATION=-
MSKETVRKEAQARFDRAEKDSGFPPFLWPVFSAAAGLSVAAAWYAFGPMVTSEDRLDLVAKCQIFPAFVFFFLFGSGANSRAPSKGASNDPPAAQALGLQSVKLIEAQRAFANTIEQFLFFFTATTALAMRLEVEMLKLIPSLYVSWCTMRIFYYFTYTSGYPRYRHLAFTGNLLPTVCAMSYAAYLTVIQGF